MTAGVFAEFADMVERIGPDQRVWVLLDLMGCTTRVGPTPDSLRVA